MLANRSQNLAAAGMENPSVMSCRKSRHGPAPRSVPNRRVRGKRGNGGRQDVAQHPATALEPKLVAVGGAHQRVRRRPLMRRWAVYPPLR